MGHRAPPRPASCPPPTPRCCAEHFAEIARRLDGVSAILNHRDFHSWNLFVQDGAIRVIDFQDALLAPGPYDLATLLGDRDTPQVVRPHIEAHLLGYYRRRWAERSGSALDGARVRRSVLPVRSAEGAEGRRTFLFSGNREEEIRVSPLHSFHGPADRTHSAALPATRRDGGALATYLPREQ